MNISTIEKPRGSRSTVELKLRVRPEVKARAIAEANALPTPIPVSQWVAALIMNADPLPPGGELGELVRLGRRVIVALNALPSEAVEARQALVDLRRAIAEALFKARANYDEKLDSRDGGASSDWRD